MKPRSEFRKIGSGQGGSGRWSRTGIAGDPAYQFVALADLLRTPECPVLRALRVWRVATHALGILTGSPVIMGTMAAGTI
jgi:hypothetical protein